MPSEITNYQCPACTGPLHFVGATGRLECDYCGSSYSVKEIEALYAEKEQKAKEAAEKNREQQAKEAAQQAQMAQEAGLSPEDLGAGWGADAAGMRAYNCPSCGAQLLCDATTAATSCPYCGNPTVVPGQFVNDKRPDYIIPFKLDREAALAALKKHYEHKPFLPKAFTDKNHLEEIKGVYVPFWLYDGLATGDMRFEATRSHTRETLRERIITTEHFQVERAGGLRFQNVPVDASTKMPDDHMDSIEPFAYNELTPFSTAYLPGFLADNYDVDKKESSRRAEGRCKATLESTLQGTVQGYESVVPRGSVSSAKFSQVKHALMPVWLLSTRWNNKTFLFAMNGQTGKLIGDLPVDKGKFWLWFGGIYVGAAALLALLLLL